MDIRTESDLAKLLHAMLMDTAALDASAAQSACNDIAERMFGADGQLQTTPVRVRAYDGQTHAIMELPTVLMAPLSLFYAREVSFEIIGDDTLRVLGTHLRNSSTRELSDEGKALRQTAATLGFNTNIAITCQGDVTQLRYTIYKSSATMTRFMEPWLDNPLAPVDIPTVEKLLVQ